VEPILIHGGALLFPPALFALDGSAPPPWHDQPANKKKHSPLVAVPS
jgi:hypothetical protein